MLANHGRGRMFLAIFGVVSLLLASVAGIASTSGSTTAAEDALVLGVDISDTRTLDPHRQFDYSPPITEHAIYETLVTMDPGDYTNVKPLLATEWELADDGAAWVFHLRPDVKFVSGNPMTADDVKFSFDRLVNLKDNPAALAENLKSVEVVDEQTVKLVMNDKTQPLLNILISPNFAIIDAKTAQEQGATSAVGADKDDTATEWLNAHSIGTGPYELSSWERNSQIVLTGNPNYWRAAPGFPRVVIRHMGDSAAQLLALQRGDIDAALNLTPEQIDSVASDANVKVEKGTSLDFVYLTLTSNAEQSEALSNQAARQAVAAAIDYDGIIEGLMGGNATRPPTFIPVGLAGITPELVAEIGYQLDPEKAKQLLADAGLADGFSFDLYYANAAVAGVSYQTVAQKIQADLSAVGITVNLKPTDQTQLVTEYRAGRLPSVMTFWNPDAPEPCLWAAASVQRVATRVGWTPPESLLQTVTDACGAADEAERNELYLDYQRQLVDQANYIILAQPIYRVATRTSITGYQLTAAGWQVNLYDIKPAA
jgi:peptide/nickel transport system substrate-binding protein